jgi:drug/metabolite transporter (DMT)-like permease
LNVLPGLLGLTFAFCIGTADFISRKSSRAIGPYTTWTYTSMLGTIGLLVLSPFLSIQINLTPYLVLVLVLLSVCQFMGGVLVYRAYQYGVFSILAPIVYSYPVVTILLAVTLLGQVLVPAQVLALAATLAGVILLTTRISDIKENLRGKKMSVIVPGVGTAIIGTTFFGFNFFGLGIAVPATGAIFPVLFSRAASFVLGFALAPVFKQDVKPERRKISRYVMTIAVLQVIGTLAFNFGIVFAGGALPIVTAMSGVGAAFVVGYATVLLREKPEKIQVLGILLAIAGVVTLLYLTP